VTKPKTDQPTAGSPGEDKVEENMDEADEANGEGGAADEPPVNDTESRYGDGESPA